MVAHVALPAVLTRAQLPAQVDATWLQHILAQGRPRGEHSSINVDGVSCPVIRRNGAAGRPILYVHGLGHDAWDFAPVMDVVAHSAGAPTQVAFDLPGFGMSSKPERPYPLSLLARALLQTIEATTQWCGAQPWVVGSSLGGHVALLAALEQPTAFAGLTLLAPGGFVDVPLLMRLALKAYYSVDAIAGRPEAELIANTRKIFAAPDGAAAHLCEQLLVRKIAVRRSTLARAFAGPFASTVHDVFDQHVVDRVAGLRVPCTMAIGSLDAVVPPDGVAAGARKCGARFVTLDGIGHCPHLEDAAATAELIIDSWRRHA